MDTDVVIVGGGAAGIAAARRLVSQGLAPLLIEASPQLGGRASTVTSGSMSLDLGCGWLHSADRNPWAAIATEQGVTVDRRTPAWGSQFRDLGFPPGEQQKARGALNDWIARLADAPPASDNAAEALPAEGPIRRYITAMAGFISGVAPDRISAQDFTTYDEASTATNWRVMEGYGHLVASSLPPGVEHRCNVAVQSVSLEPRGVRLATSAGPIRAAAAILTVSTAVLAGDALLLPPELEEWRSAAARLPLGRNEKLFLQVAPGAPFSDETQLLGNPYDAATAAYYIRPFGWPVIECFFGGESAESAAREGMPASFAHAADELVALMGSAVRATISPLAASAWARNPRIGGGYSCALPGAAAERARLARSFDDRLFFAGEATSSNDFSTAHGAYLTGIRAADEIWKMFRRRSAGVSPCR